MHQLNHLKYLISFKHNQFKTAVAHEGMNSIQYARRVNHNENIPYEFIDLVILPANSSIGVHTHSKNDMEFYIILFGEGIMVVNGCEFLVSAGDVILNPPAGTHGLMNKSSHEMRLVVIQIKTA